MIAQSLVGFNPVGELAFNRVHHVIQMRESAIVQTSATG
jgi:hypothetical protein